MPSANSFDSHIFTYTKKMDAKTLFDKWVERSKQSRPIAPNSNDMSIQEYDERTYGADSEGFYF